MFAPRPTLLDLAAAFVQIGFTCIGGAAGPLRHGIVVRRRWLDETQFGEVFGVCQALPGATGANVAIAIGGRFRGAAGAVTALAALTLPTMLFAIGLATVALRLATTDVRFAHAEAAIAAGTAGLFAANGMRVGMALWKGDRAAPRRRLLRLAISALGVILVAGVHVAIPYAVAILVGLGFIAETRHPA